MEDEIIINVKLDGTEANKQVTNQRKAVNDLKKQIKELTEADEDYTEQIQELTLQLKNEQAELRTKERLAQNIIKANKAQTGSIEQLRAQLSVVSVQWAKLSKEERENTEIGQELTAQKLALTEALKGEEKATGDTRRNVGNYTDSILEAFNATSGFNSGISNAIGGAQDLNGAFKLLVANPIGLTITVIATALTALFKGLQRTQEGNDKLNAAAAALNATFDVLIGTVGKLALDIIKAFEEPEKTLESFGDSFKEFILDKVDAAIETFSLLGSAISKLLKGEFSEALDDAAKSAEIFVDEFTVIGLAKDVVEEVTETVDELSEKIDKAVDSGLALARAQRNLELATIGFTKENAKLNAELAKTTALRDDDTKSLERQLKAAEEVTRLQEEEFNQQIKISEARAGVINRRIAQARQAGVVNRQLLQEQADAEAELTRLRGEQEQSRIENETFASQIRRDIAEQDLDVFIDFSEKQAAIIQKQVDNDSNSIAERQKFLESIRSLNDQAFAAQVKVLEEQAKGQLDVQALLRSDNVLTLNQRLKELDVSEQIATRTIEVFTNRRTALAELSQSEIDLEKEKNNQLAQFREQDAENISFIAGQNAITELTIEREKLAEQERLQIAAAQKIGASTTNIEKRFSVARQKIAQAEFQAKLELASGFTGNLAALFGEQTAIGKAAAIAQTTIETYSSATKAYSSLAAIPVVGPVLGAAAAGAAIAAGIANVKKIISVDSGLPESGATASTPTLSSGSGLSTQTASVNNAEQVLQQVATPQIGQGIVSRETLQQIQSQSPQLIVVTDEVTAQQATTESINNSRKL
jgi:hypothetical protein